MAYRFYVYLCSMNNEEAIRRKKLYYEGLERAIAQPIPEASAKEIEDIINDFDDNEEGQLTLRLWKEVVVEHQCEHLIPAREVLNVYVASVLSDKVVEMVPVKERGQLGENVFVIIHLPRVSAKVKFKSVDSKKLWN